MKQKLSVTKAMWAGGLLSIMICQSAMGAGFGMRVQSAASIGNAYSSDGTGSSDPSGIFTNPALISTFKGQNFSAGISYVKDSFNFSEGKRSLPGITPATDAGATNTGATGIGVPQTIPLLFGVHQVNDAVNVGWSVTVPWGTETKYDNSWIGRYHATSTRLVVINGDLGGSYKLNDKISFGAGLQIQQAHGKIAAASNGGAGAVKGAKDAFTAAMTAYAKGDATKVGALTGLSKTMSTAYLTAYQTAATAAAAGGATAAATAGATAGAAAATAVGNAAYAQLEGKNDIQAEYKGDDYSYGYNFGVLYTPIPELRLGLSYRSAVTHKNKGNVTFVGDTAVADAVMTAGGLSDSSADMKLTLPSVIVAGASYALNPEISLFANVTRYQWSSIDSLDIKYKSDTRDIIAKLAWKDTIAASVGTTYQLNPAIALRFGLGIDQSPTVDQYRSPRTPDNSRTLIGIGAGYKLEKGQIDLGYAHLIVKNAPLDLKETDYAEASGRGNLSGTYKVGVDLATLQYSMAI